MSVIYLDYNATTPLDQEVADIMRPFLEGCFGNPSSDHILGYEARKTMAVAREQAAGMLGCSEDEIFFTSGGTESNNLAIRGMALSLASRGRHIISSVIEHPSVMEVCRYLEGKGFEVSYAGVDTCGRVRPEEIRRLIRKDTILLSVMHANNETGTIQPIGEIAALARENGIVFHSDCAQSIGKIPVKVTGLGVDMLSVAGHKFYGPKGIGALYIRRGLVPEKLLHGADHERHLRPGTENVMAIAGLGKACERAAHDLPTITAGLDRLRNRLQGGLLEAFPEAIVHGHPEHRLPNTLSISFPGMDANRVLDSLEGLAASTGAACHSGDTAASYVLKAMGVNETEARGTIRLSTGKYTTEREIDQALEMITRTLHRLGYAGNRKGEGKSYRPTGCKLTHYTSGLGCACKMRPQFLSEALEIFTPSVNPDVLVSLDGADDASVYRIDPETAIVQSVDFFTPVVDSPYDFGSIAAANSLSDLYAMGARPLFALSIVGFPSGILPVAVLREILSGAVDKCAEAGIEILGGHTVEDTEPKFGLVVTGRIHPGRILKNSGAKAGDLLILTKPLGTGIITTAAKKGMDTATLLPEAIKLMKSLNKTSSEIMISHNVSACTDVTGFGFMGHLVEMLRASRKGAGIFAEQVPLIKGSTDLAAMQAIPGGTLNNLAHVSRLVEWGPSVSQTTKILLCDAQTSGGLLCSIPEKNAGKLLDELHSQGITDASVVGKVTRQATVRVT